MRVFRSFLLVLLTLSLLVFWQCKKVESAAELQGFSVTLKFNHSVAPSTLNPVNFILLVTMEDGSLVDTFSFAAITLQEKTFELEVPDGTEHVHLHLARVPTSTEAPPIMHSHLKVPNGAFVAFGEQFDHLNQPYDDLEIRVEGSENLYQMYVPMGAGAPKNLSWNPAGYWSFNITNNFKQGVFILGKDSVWAEQKHLFIPATTLATATSPLVVSWNDSQTSPAPLFLSAWSAFPNAFGVSLYAVNNDRSEMIPLSNWDANITDFQNLPVYYPAELPDNVCIVAARQPYFIQKILPAGAPLVLEDPSIGIGDVQWTSGESIQASSTGDVDLMQAKWFEPGSYNWTINGAPDAFSNVQLPDSTLLAQYLGMPSGLPLAFHKFWIVVYKFDDFSFEQFRDGTYYSPTVAYGMEKGSYAMFYKKFE